MDRSKLSVFRMNRKTSRVMDGTKVILFVILLIFVALVFFDWGMHFDRVNR